MQQKIRKPEIIREDGSIIVCHKPAGLATQTRRVGEPDMESLLRNYRAQKGEEPYIGIVHRLDQPVEGIMAFAKNRRAAAVLSEQVKNRTVGKYYYAVVRIPQGVCGKPGKVGGAQGGFCLSEGTLTDAIFFDPKQNYAVVVPEEEANRGGGAKKAQKAQLHYAVKADRDGLALLDVTLHTGRHHQIRAQLAHIGCPIVGDTKYGNRQARADAGLALCAYRLVFAHPADGARVDVSIEPENMLIRELLGNSSGRQEYLHS